VNELLSALRLEIARPALLWLALLALLPWLLPARQDSPWPWLGAVPTDGPSRMLDLGLRALGALCVIALALACAGLYRSGETVQRLARGAHLALLVDRSSSMNNSFAEDDADDTASRQESKAAAAKRLLKGFAERRPHDRIGVVAFSTSPMLVMPLSDHCAATEAALDAIDRPGLAYTDVGRGLAMALDLFDADTEDSQASRAVVLVSDGAAVIDRRIQAKLREALSARPVSLYWLFLRTKGSAGPYEQPTSPEDDTPQVMPERHLHLFFQSLGVPYRAFEASSADDVATAIDEIDRQQLAELRYLERIPRRDLSSCALGVAAFCLTLLVAVRLLEVRVDLPSRGAA
jgi:mxaC protein